MSTVRTRPTMNDEALFETPTAPVASLRSVEEELVEAKRALEFRTEELTTSLSLISGALESTADGIVVLDLSGKVVLYNTKFSDIWHFPPDLLQRRDIQGLREFAAVQTTDRQAFIEAIRRQVSNPERETFDTIKLKDGRIFERYGFPQRVNGVCVGMVVNFREVTQRTWTEAALRLSEEKYRLLWATAEDAFVLFDDASILLEANAAVETMFGHQPEEVIGQPLSILQPERMREAHRRGLQRYLETGVRTLKWSAAEAIGLHRDGHEIPIEIAFNHLHLEGKDIFAGFIRDISARKQAEQSLAHLAAIVGSSHDAIMSKTVTGIITSWNHAAEELFGYSASEVIGLPMSRLIPPDRADEEPHLLSRLALGEKMDHFDTIRIRKDGHRIEVSITLSPILDTAGKVIGISTIARDITQRKQAEAERASLLKREKEARQEAEVANRAKDEFLATLSHELRTPLNTILGWAQLLGDSRVSEESKAQGLEIIQRNALLQTRLVEDILDVSRITAGKLRLEVRLLELSHVVEGAVESVVLTAQAKAIQLHYVPASGAILVLGDATRLQQVIWNLLNNAIKFTPNGGQVHVRLERVGAHVEIIVTDTGVGIDAEVLPHIFERFRQGNQSSTRNHGGLGLGLAIVLHMVEAHDGSVEVHSQGENQGATFKVILPTTEPELVEA